MLVRAALAGGVSIALLRAFMGPGPEKVHPELALVAGFVAITGYPIALIVAAARHPVSATLVICGSVVLMALAVWAVRGSDDDGGDDPEDDPVPPIDWEAFDHERDRWERTPAR